MTDCPDADLRDLLPDYVHGALPVGVRARVDAHLTACVPCRDELALLRAVRGARVEPYVPDVARIVAALPRPVARARSTSSNVLTLDGSHPGVARTPRWRRSAAVAALLVGAAGVGVVWRLAGADGRDAPVAAAGPHVAPAGDAPLPAATSGLEPRVASIRDTPVTAGGAQRSREARRTAEATDAVGALGGIASGATEDELEALSGGLESLSGIPEVESVEGEESARTTGAHR